MIYNYNGKVFYQDLPGFLKSIPELTREDFHRHGRWVQYADIPASFDIETTSTRDNLNQKVAIMYVWQLGIAGSVLIGRTWDELKDALEMVAYTLSLTSDHRRLIIYVHNLAFEFQFIKDRFEWDDVFALKAHKVLYAICEPFEFRCSYLLSNMALARVGKNLTKYKIEKAVGDLDYSLIRHQETELTPQELNYCSNDVRVVMAYIAECIEETGGIEKVPLTNTGRVREYCREICLSAKRYRYLIRDLTIDTPEEYATLKSAFMGGFTHANAQHACVNMKNVGSIDLASDYPARIVLDYFPMSKATYYPGGVDYAKIQNILNTKCCIFTVSFHNIKPAVPYENILSVHRIRFLENQRDYVQNNGRLVTCKGWIQTTLTEIDLEWVMKFYTFDDIEIKDLYTYERGYLPTELVQAVLDFYQKKTSLKGIDDKYVEYMVSKNMINSTYGMMVTDIMRDNITYTQEGWQADRSISSGRLSKYNFNRKRFLFYPWGIYVTAHARAELYSAIMEFGDDYVYSDTDSIKGINYDSHKDWINNYNSNIITKIIDSALYHHLSHTLYMPKDKNGKTHPIGIFEYEGNMEVFRTCGAKRYIYWQDGEFHMTVAGLGKYDGAKYLESKYKTRANILKHFDEGLTVPAGHTGKLTHTYIDAPRTGIITDYQGKTAFYEELSGTHLEPAAFSMSMLDSYLDYLHGIDEIIYTE